MSKFEDILNNINPEEKHPNDRVLLIDGLNIFLRAFAVNGSLNEKGVPVGGITGFMKSLAFAIREMEPTRVIVTYDGAGGSKRRRKINPKYKANRTPKRVTKFDAFNSLEDEKEAMKIQFRRLLSYLELLPIDVYSVDNVEADDVIAYLAQNVLENEVIIMSADQDFLQLVSTKTSVYSPTKKKIYKPKDVLEQFGVTATNYINYKILLGDKSDNVPGVSGLGPVKLVKLFPELTGENKVTLEDMITKSAELINENKLYLSVVERRHQLFINQQLMNLEGDFLSPDNRLLVKQAFTECYELNKYLFHQIYVNDRLGESIPNVDNWLTEVFGYLNSLN